MGRLLDALARAFAFAGGAVLVGVTGMSVASIAGRALRGTPVPGDFELVQVCSAAAIAAFLPYCQLRRGHIIVDFFTARAPRRVQDGLDAFGALLLTGVMAVLAWRTLLGLLTVKASREITMIVGFPVWIGYAAIVPSLVLATIVGLYTTVEALRGRRD
ncbi:MAG TPA: TRAP transporter small permease [Terriglobales bacterium]|nr:TRAP transporter small permease [Terriglobales bacterium]